MTVVLYSSAVQVQTTPYIKPISLETTLLEVMVEQSTGSLQQVILLTPTSQKTTLNMVREYILVEILETVESITSYLEETTLLKTVVLLTGMQLEVT